MSDTSSRLHNLSIWIEARWSGTFRNDHTQHLPQTMIAAKHPMLELEWLNLNSYTLEAPSCLSGLDSSDDDSDDFSDFSFSIHPSGSPLHSRHKSRVHLAQFHRHTVRRWDPDEPHFSMLSHHQSWQPTFDATFESMCFVSHVVMVKASEYGPSARLLHNISWNFWDFLRVCTLSFFLSSNTSTIQYKRKSKTSGKNVITAFICFYRGLFPTSLALQTCFDLSSPHWGHGRSTSGRSCLPRDPISFATLCLAHTLDIADSLPSTNCIIDNITHVLFGSCFCLHIWHWSCWTIRNHCLSGLIWFQLLLWTCAFKGSSSSYKPNGKTDCHG